jgi:hypothetical protein
MLSLIETLTGFAAIMLMLSLLVKTLTSVIKNQLDYYSDNLEHEVKRLVLETTGKTWDEIVRNKNDNDPTKSLAMEIHWERLGDEFLTPAYLSWFLKQMDQNARVFDLESRLKIHMANVKYTFEMRMKNLALAVGLSMCLLYNINAFTIWKSLYTDQQLRATFADRYADKATALANAQATQGADPNKKPTNEELNAQVKSLRENMQGFLTDVSFGVGRIWREECLVLTDKLRQKCQENNRKTTAAGAEVKPAQEKKDAQSVPGTLIYEFFGSLLTGILVSIGAPYWHDILQALSSLRSTGSAAKAKT